MRWLYDANGTYTFAQDSFNRERIHGFIGINYQKTNAEDKAKSRPQLAASMLSAGSASFSGSGTASYSMKCTTMSKARLFAALYGTYDCRFQYALGDLKADDSPSEK